MGLRDQVGEVEQTGPVLVERLGTWVRGPAPPKMAPCSFFCSSVISNRLSWTSMACVTHADDDGLSALGDHGHRGAMCSPLISPTVRMTVFAFDSPGQFSDCRYGRFHAVEGVRRPELLGHIAL